MNEYKDRSYYVQGGICPGNFRSTVVSTMCNSDSEGSDIVEYWAKKNFSDWNHIGATKAKPLIKNIKDTRPISVSVCRRK